MSGDREILYAVGDIHGHPRQLQRIVRMIREDAQSIGIDRPAVVFLGDYVDRGPDSKGALDILTNATLREQIDPIFLCGNHDAAMLSILNTGMMAHAHEWLMMYGGMETIESYGVDTRTQGMRSAIDRFVDAVPRVHKEFLTLLEDSFETCDVFFSHAGVDPGLPLEEQDAQTLLHGSKDMFKSLLWTAGIEKLVVHGHWTAPEIVVKDRRIGIDTRCGFDGGHLSAIRLNGRKLEKVFPELGTWENVGD